MTNDVYIGESFDEYLEHHGILGMKWGVRRTPEQLGHRVSKKRERFEEYSAKSIEAGEAGKKRSFSRYKKKAERAYKQEVKLSKTLEKALKKQVEKDNEIVNKGSVDDVLAISDRLSEDQINRAIKRIQNQNRLKGLKEEDMAKVDKLISFGKKVADVSGSVYNIANNVRNFKNVMKDIQKDQIKEEESITEKARAKSVESARRSGDIAKMKKVWGSATLDELKNMETTLRYRSKIEEYDKKDTSSKKTKKEENPVIKNTSKEEVKSMLDEYANVMFSENRNTDGNVDWSTPKYWYSYTPENIKKLGK